MKHSEKKNPDHASSGPTPEKVFTSQTVWGRDELVEQLDETARAHRLLRKPGRGPRKPSLREQKE